MKEKLLKLKDMTKEKKKALGAYGVIGLALFVYFGDSIYASDTPMATLLELIQKLMLLG